MIEPNWVNIDVIKAIHTRQIQEHGGLHGIRDEKLLISALNTPHNTFLYEKADLITLASKYLYSLSSNHPFVDGNKRTAYICMRLFLKLNGKDFKATEEEKIELMINVASQRYKDDEIIDWLKQHILD